jgi:hypothetical protein
MALRTINTLTLLLALLLTSCYYDVAERFPTNTCDETFTFNSRILPLVQQQCASSSCHSGANPAAGLSLTNYNEIKAIVDNGSFVSSLTGTNGYSIMPKGTSGLTACDQTAITNWINAGALNN